jgi:hypothetical protein
VGKALSFIVSLAFLLTTSVVADQAYGGECGDVNGADGITASDALLLLKKAVGEDVAPLVCPAAQAGVVATGQTLSYSPQDDGDLQLGAERSFTDNGDGTVTDNATGLMWEKLSDDGTIHDKDNTYSWPDAFKKVSTLNGSSFAGYGDWRLPNRFELETLLNLGANYPATYPAFSTKCSPGCKITACSCTAAANYWSSTTFVAADSNAWFVAFWGGFVDYFGFTKADRNFVRAVRGGS